ncbi:YIP1 family protein [Bacteroides thetaiotaomicron]|uniref:YIP1 family protein n=1 Tax=Bacteroides thetaiotaomicron TaxID=818 RepID=UPI0021669463|nr:YIP1 family protein [Bacteroides thetaiotaomicron]MCS3197487.1 YIP1 family protein [Bacteroides thetaiotaomicron]
MKNKVKLIANPFIRIAGGQALIWGFLGLIVSTLLCWISGYHYHGLLHFGPAPNPAWWCYLAEHLIVWLIPALLFYLGGLFLSHSRIRVIDVLGTVLFAQLPLLGMNLISLLPAMRMMSQMNMNMSPEEMLAQPYFVLAMILTLLGLPFLILTLIWMFNALKVSCNLKQWKLWTVALIGIIGGDVLCRLLIEWLY